MTRDSWISSLRSKRSASLPQIGVLAVSASSVEVTTQVYADWPPPRSEMIRGSEVDTTVLARMVTNRPSSRPDMASSTWRWVMTGRSVTSGMGIPSLVRDSCHGQPCERRIVPGGGRARSDRFVGEPAQEPAEGHHVVDRPLLQLRAQHAAA